MMTIPMPKAAGDDPRSYPLIDSLFTRHGYVEVSRLLKSKPEPHSPQLLQSKPEAKSTQLPQSSKWQEVLVEPLPH